MLSGGDIPCKLVQANYEVLRQEIDLSELPANFRDAVSIARHLGVKYVWVDSL